MNQTYTLLSLCEAYQKIEIPIIQRNYVQGNDKTIRCHFVDYLVKALTQQSPVELDFVYGAERQDTQLTDNCAPQVGKVLIPLDGQQRLTTLWLLHGYLLALEQVSNNPEQLSPEKRETQCQLLSRFVYETRQSAKDFCGYWLQEVTQRACPELVDKPSKYLRNCAWFDPEWEKEGTVTAMLGMLDEVASKRAELQAVPYGRLSKCIRFYYLPIEKFGLSNELYIRMNARGEQLTSFEHFKSSFYKVIQDHSSLSAIKEKMEYDWVDALWQYRPKDTHVTDHPFMKCLSFVTEVLHIKGYSKGTEDNIPTVYQKPDAVNYLEDTLDCVEQLKGIQYDNLLKDKNAKSFQEILARMLTQGTKDDIKRILLYTAIAYFHHHNTIDGIVPLLRVVRNLSKNTKTENNLTKIYKSLDELVKVPNIYDYLAQLQGSISGFSDTQLEEEKAKAQLRLARPEVNVLLDEIEDFFSGKIFNLLCEVAETATLNEWVEQPQRIDLDTLQRTFKAYQSLSEMPRIEVTQHSHLFKDTTHCGFREILGDLLMTDIYQEDTVRNRYQLRPDWRTARPMFHFIKGFADFWQEGEKGTSLFVDSLAAYCEKVEREKIQTLIAQTQEDLSSLTHPGEQLFVYYVITRRLMQLSAHDFFAYGEWGDRANNFAWLPLPSNQQGNPTYRSLFSQGIVLSKAEGETASTRMIYQKYKDQFRYSYGLREGVALPPEYSKYPNYDQLTSDPLSTLKEWAK
ncbi:MAG: DUF262 domain-containing protein [Alloprevotella sp.]|nr:DUF262 domain-containing protein [Alloprevotella sp.]